VAGHARVRVGLGVGMVRGGPAGACVGRCGSRRWWGSAGRAAARREGGGLGLGAGSDVLHVGHTIRAA
jgi:hypothetical protein